MLTDLCWQSNISAFEYAIYVGHNYLLRSKHLLISWLQSPSAVILEPRKIKSDTVSTVSPSISHEVMGPDAAGSSKKQESSRKTSISVLLTMPKPLTAWITMNCGKF